MTKHWLRILALTILLLLLLRIAGLVEAYPGNPRDQWVDKVDWLCEPGSQRYVISRDGQYAGTGCLDPAFVQAMNQLIPCESGDAIKFETYYRQEPNGTVSAGRLQINSIHRERMAHLGLTWENEKDRWRFGQVLWQEQGFHPWSCSR